MTETHIGVWKAPHAANVWYWQHPGCAWNAESTLAAAADAGRAHLKSAHPIGAFEAQMPAVAHGDPEPAYGAHRCSGECPPAPSDPLDRAHNEGSRR